MHSTIFNFSYKLYDADDVCEQMEAYYIDHVEERSGEYAKNALVSLANAIGVISESIQGNIIVITNYELEKAIDCVENDYCGFWVLTGDCDSLMLKQWLIRLYELSNQYGRQNVVLKLSQVFDYHSSWGVDDLTVNETCPYCDNEIELKWNTDILGFQIYCPYCGKKIMLCDDCMHNPDWKCNCDFDKGTHSCHRKEV